MTARDDLAADIRGGMWACCDACRDNEGPTEESYAIADHLLAAGWSRPRVVTTEDDLDALPDGSIVVDAVGTVWCRRDGLWCEAGYAEGLETWEVVDDTAGLPARILWSPPSETDGS